MVHIIFARENGTLIYAIFLLTRQDNSNKTLQFTSNNVITFKQLSNNHQNNELEKIGVTLVEVLTSINHLTLSTETIIVPETQDNDRMNYFLVNTLSQ